jgi:hypothetical protein
MMEHTCNPKRRQKDLKLEAIMGCISEFEASLHSEFPSQKRKVNETSTCDITEELRVLRETFQSN